MARPQVHLVSSAGFQNARDRVWAAIRTLAAQPRARPEDQGVFVSSDIEFITKLNPESVKKVLGGLITAGYVAPAAGARRAKNGYGQLCSVRLRLVRDVGVEPPRINNAGAPLKAGLGQEQLWRSMRMLRDWSVDELAAQASTAQAKVARGTALNYARTLLLAGYLVRAGKRGKERYRLLPTRSTGPRPPVVQGSGAVFDVNLGRIVWQP